MKPRVTWALVVLACLWGYSSRSQTSSGVGNTPPVGSERGTAALEEQPLHSGKRQSSSPPRKPGNVFLNPGFEEGAKPWFFLKGNRHWLGFSVVSSLAHSGRASARIRMEVPPDKFGTKVYGLIQEASPKGFPDYISGYYRIEQWQRGTPKQYLQFVVIVWEEPAETRVPNYQIRYILTGIDSPPFKIGNAKFVFVGNREPIIGEWIRFERNIREDFKNLWGRIPSRFVKVRVLFEARYDDKTEGSGQILAEVYYDDLFFGWKDDKGDGLLRSSRHTLLRPY